LLDGVPVYGRYLQGGPPVRFIEAPMALAFLSRGQSSPAVAYLLYEVVDAIAEWLKDTEALTKPGDVLIPDQFEGNHIHISLVAAEAIGRVVQTILMSPRVPRRLKDELLGVALATLRDLERCAHLAPLARVMRGHLIEPCGFKVTARACR
jgi:hypothetical protein